MSASPVVFNWGILHISQNAVCYVGVVLLVYWENRTDFDHSYQMFTLKY